MKNPQPDPGQHVHSWIDYVQLAWMSLRKCKGCPAFLLNEQVLVPEVVGK